MKLLSRKDIGLFFSPLKKHKGTLLILSLRSIQYGVQGSIVALSMKYIIDAITKNDISSAYAWLIVVGAFAFLGDVPAYFFRNINRKFNRAVESHLYQTYIGKYIVGDNNAFETLGTGRINNIISKGISSWNNNLGSIPVEGVRFVVGLISGFLVVGLNMGRKGFLIFCIIFGLSFIFVQYSNRKIRIYRKERRELVTEYDRNILRLIMSKFEVLQNNKLQSELSKIGAFYQNIFKVWKRESKQNIMTFDLQRFTFSALRVGFVGYIIGNISNGMFSIGDLALYRMILNQIYTTIQDLNNYVSSIYVDAIYIEKLRDVFGKTPEIKGYNNGENIKFVKGDIELDKITYTYGKGDVLNDFSLCLEGGKKTAFVGISGSGKSTIVKLIAGYINPQKGEVLIDSQALPNEENADYVSLKSYYKHIGYLTQEPNVFDGTVYDNLIYALDYEPTQQQLESAIQGAQCQFIYEFPDGVLTEIGEKGIKLSGGQRQRLAIAKVMLKNPDIIILDEPTSALDSFSEEEVTKALNNLFVGKTVIIIAHRLQTVKKADRIIVLDHGKIVEDGNHDSLVQSGGVYAKMLELQSGF